MVPLLQYVMWNESCSNLSCFTWNVGIQNQSTLLLPESIKHEINSNDHDRVRILFVTIVDIGSGDHEAHPRAENLEY